VSLQDTVHKSVETAWWVKAGSVYPGDHAKHAQDGSLALEQYKAMYNDFGNDDKGIKHLIEV
jgi:hypothetical protein